jgi:hypothetical protein
MAPTYRWIATGALLLLFGTGRVAAQTQVARTPNDPLDAPCALLSAAEVNQATGRRDYDDGDVLGVRSAQFEGASVCMYGFGDMMDGPGEAPPMITVGIAAQESSESSAEQMLREGPRTGCRREEVSSVGRVAFVEACSDDITLQADVGRHGLLITINLGPSMSEAAASAALMALGKAASASLRH